MFEFPKQQLLSTASRMSYYIQDFCCICLKISNEKWSKQFSKYPDNLTPFDKIKIIFQTLSAVMDSEDRICKKCSGIVDLIYEFHKTCLKNINILSSYKEILKENTWKTQYDLSIDLSERKQFKEIPKTYVEIRVEPLELPVNHNDMLCGNDLISESHLNGAAEVKEEIELNYEKSGTSWLDSEEKMKGVDVEKEWMDEINETREDESLKSNIKDSENIFVQLNEEVFIKDEENVELLNDLTVQEVAEEQSIERPGQNESFMQEKTIHEVAEQFECVECGKTLSCELDLDSHMLTHSNMQTFAGINGHPCDICGKLFEQKQQLKLHILKHNTYKCNFCDKIFNRSRSLSRHKFLHTGEKAYKCDLCEKSYNNPSSLSRHKLLHTGEKPFKCDICGKLFTQKSHLKSHILIHTGEKPHKCDICGNSFTRKEVLKHHILTHTGEKPYKCKTCEKSFRQKINLEAHNMSIHIGDKRHKCDICGKLFAQKRFLTYHARKHHEKPQKL